MRKEVLFDWDEGNKAKCRKHGVSVAEIEALLGNEPRVAPDIGHSLEEDRLIAIGRNSAGRAMFVAFTIRNRGAVPLIRPISARYMHRKEVKQYET